MRSALIALLLTTAVGCATSSRPPTSADSAYARRAHAFRGAVDAQWEAVREAHRAGANLSSRYVFALSELRTGAIRAQLETLLYDPKARREAETWLDQAEKVLPQLLAAQLTGPATTEAINSVNIPPPP